MRSAMAAIWSGVLPWPEDDLREPLPERPVVIDAGEAEVFERRLAQNLKEPVLGRLRREDAGADIVEEGAKLGRFI